ncbi:hypothetical protein [Streptomyces sp. ODS28]|uniref:hypothetical protein n=1 Tax=Streptomyces sp. ODS28 TaxID=3136688 RepID=UPI0031E9B622
MNPTVVVALIGVVSAVTAAIINGALVSRSKAGEDVRSGRMSSYPLVWELTSAVPRWPRKQLTHRAAAEWHRGMRQWYFTAPAVGGMYLSENARARYGGVQELLFAYLDGVEEDNEPFSEDIYDSLVAACSEFRSALTEDLQSRRVRSPVWVISRFFIHRRHAARSKARIATAQRQR